MEIYALIGPSGTGKSYKALEIAYDKNIDYIIDDGLLIHKNKIIAGISAKQAKTTIEAVKRAIFHNNEHKDSVKGKILEENIERLLILATSEKMINQIIGKLGIKCSYKVINITDISTEEEINKAKESRRRGNHIIPVPTVQIKPMVNGLSINPLKRLFRKNNEVKTVLEKTIIKPTFSYIGKFLISQNVIQEIIEYEINNFYKIDKINKIDINNLDGNLNIFINVNINNMEMINELIKVQEAIKKSVEIMTLINVSAVNIYINKLKISKYS